MTAAILTRPVDADVLVGPLRNRLPGLAQLQRRVLHLRYWEELPIGAAALILGLPVDVTRALERTALNKLFGQLTGGTS